MKIAVDAMGGDYAPEAIVEGAVQAAEEYGTSIILVGQKDLVDKELEKYETTYLNIEVRHASQIVDMHDLPSFALRRKKDSSLHVAINLIRLGEAEAAVSAGNTGAAMAISKLACRTLEGIERPAIATVMPNISGLTVVIDVGANVDCKPVHILQFAVMGHVYAKELLGIEDPRIGLLSIGEESSKGNELTKEVFEPLRKVNLNFIGNAEGRDVFNGRVDVIVCDGFTGNVVLKVSESLAKMIGSILKEGFTKNWRTKLGYLLVKPALAHLKKRTDYREYGGAPLLGLNGVVIISHGSSKAKAIKNAIRVACESVDLLLQEKIAETMAQCAFDIKSRKRATSFWRQLKHTIRHESDKEKLLTEEQENPKQEDLFQEREALPELTSPQEPDQEQEKPQEPEYEKRAWWQLGDSKHRTISESEEQTETEENAQIEELPHTPVLEYEQESHRDKLSQDQEQSQESRSERKPWWRLKDSKHRERDDNSSEHDEEAEAEERVQEQEHFSNPTQPQEQDEQQKSE